MKNNRATILDVAQKAGVSITSVSFAFNNPDQIGVETAERIRQIAKEIGYAPNAIARAMISRSTGVIGILVPMTISSSFSNPFIPEFMTGIGEICDRHSLGALIVSPFEGSLLQATQRAPVDGFIVLGLNENHVEIEPLRHRNVPFVIVDGESETVSQVNVDDEGGAFASADYLLQKGHRNIMMMTFQKPDPAHYEDVFYGVGGRRLKGYQRGFEQNGLEFNFGMMVQSLTSIEGGREAFTAAWQSGFHPSAVLAVSDAMAIGVMEAAQDLGLKVPDDLEVIGFDDINLARVTRPALSTVHQPILEKGTLAATLLYDAITGNGHQEKVVLPTRLELRGSTRR